MTWFWIVAAIVALASIVIVARPLLRPPSGARSRAAHDEQVFRDQLAELDRDVARGVLAESEAQSAKVEVSRRLLAAAAERERMEGPLPAPRSISRVLAIVLALAAPIGATALYFAIASPGHPDRPLAERLANARQPTSQADIERILAAEGFDPAKEALEADPSLAEFVPLVEKLRLATESRPGDLRGAQLLANSLRRLGRYSEAWPAYARVIQASGDAATVGDYHTQVEAMIYAAAGFVSDDALEVSNAGAERFGPTGTHLYVTGLHAAQRGDPDRARAFWTEAISIEPDRSPVAEAAQAQLTAMGAALSRPASPPSAAEPGPNAEDMQAASQMSASDRQAMIEGMVEGLQERLRSEGGDVNEWARLIRALSVLERADDAKAAYVEASQIFQGDSTALAFLTEQALLSGVATE